MAMALKDRIIEAMTEANLSAADLARATEKTPGAVTQWTNGMTKSLKADTATKIERATGFRASWLVDGKGPKKVGDTQPGTIFDQPTPQELEFLNDFRRLTDKEQRRYMAEIKARAEELAEYVDQHLVKFLKPTSKGTR
jgi:transcriptional regulator with XRE-family HTH domain